MTTPSTEQNPAELSLQSDEAKAIVAEIKADNAALEEAAAEAGVEAEAVAQQAQVTDEVLEELEELQEAQEASGPA
jgi:hypothetical protein